jgi:hypothetical protein
LGSSGVPQPRASVGAAGGRRPVLRRQRSHGDHFTNAAGARPASRPAMDYLAGLGFFREPTGTPEGSAGSRDARAWLWDLVHGALPEEPECPAALGWDRGVRARLHRRPDSMTTRGGNQPRRAGLEEGQRARKSGTAGRRRSEKGHLNTFVYASRSSNQMTTVPVDGIDLMPGLCLFDFYVHCPQDSQSQMVAPS